MKSMFIGIDNGVTGSIGIICNDGAYHFPTPNKTELSYTKKKQNITRIDNVKLSKLLSDFTDNINSDQIILALERPMVNPGRWKATVSAIRALESTLVVIEHLNIPMLYIDSKEWQKVMLPSGIKGAPELKAASLQIGCRLFPHLEDSFKKDADGILIAEYIRSRYENL